MKKYLSAAGLILVAIIWGAGFAASDIALISLKPFQIMMIRFLLASVLMGLVGFKKLKGITKNEVKAGVMMGCALFAGFALQIIGLQYTTPSKNAFLTATNVVLVPFIAFVIYKKKVGANGVLGAILALAGVGILSLERNLTMGLGDALTLMCAAGFAMQIFLTGEFAGKYRASVLNFIQMCTAFSLSLVCLLISGQIHFNVSRGGWLSVLYLGVISTTLTYLLQTTCQKYVDETKAAILLSMESVFGTLFSIVLLHERITARMILGCIIILAAVIISNLGPNAGGSRVEDCGKPGNMLK